MLHRRLYTMVELEGPVCDAERFKRMDTEGARNLRPSKPERIFWCVVISISIVMTIFSVVALIDSLAPLPSL